MRYNTYLSLRCYTLKLYLASFPGLQTLKISYCKQQTHKGLGTRLACINVLYMTVHLEAALFSALHLLQYDSVNGGKVPAPHDL